MMREYHVRICERLGVKLPGPTRHLALAVQPLGLPDLCLCANGTGTSSLIRRRPIVQDRTFLQPYGRATKPADDAHVMADQKRGSPFATRDRVHLAEAILLKFSVADRKHRVDNKDRLQMRGDRRRDGRKSPKSSV